MAAPEAKSSYLLFFPLLLAALIVSIIRLPEALTPFRPDFLSLILIFFAVYDPRRINIGWAWLAGLLLDFLMGAPLAQNALCVSLQVFIILSQFKRFAQFNRWQQVIIVFIVNWLGHGLGFWISHIAGAVTYDTSVTIPAVITALLWTPACWLCLLLCQVLNIAPDAPKEN